MKRILKKCCKAIPALMMCGAGMVLTACFDDPETTAEKYADWKEQNERYVKEAEAKKNADGTPYYTRIAPSWAPSAYALVHWHNDRKLTENNLSPMDNSTTQITYELYDVEGTKLSDSFAKTDSLYTSRPNQNIVGVWVPLTYMHVGDSVTIVIPYEAGYGMATNGNIKPYSTLVYGIKLKAVPAYEVP